MKTFWLYLEPYTFLWVRKERALVYNTLTQKGFEFRNRGRVKKIATQLTDPQKMYCVKISAEDIENPRFNSFIKMVRKSFSGDLIETSLLRKKPFIFIPFLNLQGDVKRLLEISDRTIGDDILTYLNRVDFYINGSCNNKCAHCYRTFKQMPFCFHSNSELPIRAITNFLHQIRSTSVNFINILGGNIFLYKYFEELIDELDCLSVIKTFYLHYLNLPSIKHQIHFFIGVQFRLKILVNFPINKHKLSSTIDLFKNIDVNTEWFWTITSKKEYEEVDSIIEQFQLEETEIKPVFTGNNLKFFEENIYLEKEDILNTQLSRREIFAHQALNANDFGKLTIMSDGKVYANVNHKSLGNIEDDVRELIYKEMDNGTSWRRIRDMKPCCKCVYQWLCPSPSNYELMIGKPNLCHLEY